jgi:phage shock protein PspC (stress-responsive transcriptional regulator)
MVFCSKCGQENLAEAKFCSRCGHELIVGPGNTMKGRLTEWGAEVEEAGERLEKNVDRRFTEKSTDFDKAFGMFGPLVKTVICFIVLVIIAEVLLFVGRSDHLTDDLGIFMIDYLPIFFLMFAIFSYSAYINRNRPKGYQYFRPVVAAIGMAFSLWVTFSILTIIGDNYDVEILSWMADLTWIVLPLVFILMLLVGYAEVVTEQRKQRPSSSTGMSGATQLFSSQPNQRRLYRSRNDRVLGGVCAGLAEHFNVDPLVMRVIWILLLCASFGVFLLIYVLMWIIVPNGP